MDAVHNKQAAKMADNYFAGRCGMLAVHYKKQKKAE